MCFSKMIINSELLELVLVERRNTSIKSMRKLNDDIEIWQMLKEKGDCGLCGHVGSGDGTFFRHEGSGTSLCFLLPQNVSL